MKQIIFILLAIWTTQSFAQSSFEKKEFTTAAGERLNYQVLKPEVLKKGEKYPLVLFLHGAGERGNDNQSQMVHGSGMFTNPVNQEQYPSIVLFPQCPTEGYWTFEKRPEQLIKEVFLPNPPLTPILSQVMEMLEWHIKNMPIDPKRIYVVGLSMGGMATFDLASRYPDLFAAAIPICGAVHPERLKAAAGKVNFRLFHGDADNVVSAEFSRNAYRTLKQAKAQVEYYEFPGINHNSWTPAFNKEDFIKWLYSQKK